MEKEFIPYEQALALKELGFDEPCLAWYNIKGVLLSDITIGYESSDFLYQKEDMDNNQCIVPTFSQAFRFFREKHKLQPSVNSFCFEEYSFNIMGSRNEILYPIHNKLLNDGKRNPWEFDTYEEAELACLKKLIEIVKQ